MSEDEQDWLAGNQQHLMAAVARVRRAIETGTTGSQPLEERRAQSPPLQEMSPPSALDRLCETFGLSPFERDIVVLCAGVDLDASFARVLAGPPTFALALAALPGAHWSALTPVAPLRRWRLIEMAPGESITQSPMRIDERILHFLTGVSYPDERCLALVNRVDGGDVPVGETHAATAMRIATLIAGLRGDAPIIELSGNDPTAKRSVAAAVCGGLGLQLFAMAQADVPSSAADRELFARLWEREWHLGGAALLLDAETANAEARRTMMAFATHLRSVAFIATREPIQSHAQQAIRFDVSKLPFAEQRRVWDAALGPRRDEVNGTVDLLASHFDLSAGTIHLISAAASADDDRPLGEALWDACRSATRPRLDDLAQRIRPAATWDDLVLPPLQTKILREIAVHVRHRARVYEEWGFAAGGARGLGIAALFSGPSGTGKTMAAEVLANELALDLYRIDLSSVVSKYIGETEENLRKVFDAAEEGGAILLFDEADALFGKRTDVKDSHDRYANIEVSYLLQRMEAYRGLALLTTNMKAAIDSAFLRRLRFVVTFPFPDPTQRVEIWRRVFPKSTPVAELDLGRLARLNVAGGNIRNIAVGAAFLAAQSGAPVHMDHLLSAARSEYAKLERQLTETEAGGWV
ncbi:MAG TPA: ATP-binding protein [Thermoanaerobaculia bacterium]|nr:ATP-binding protein [Thermoanaerobaculia bacterium]